MLIETPCRLGERFEHTKPWGDRGPLYFVGLSLFWWGLAGMDGVTLDGSTVPYIGPETGFYSRDDIVARPIAFEVPDGMVSGAAGVPMGDLGLDSAATGWLTGVHLKDNGRWVYTVSKGIGIPPLKVRTEELDRLFAPVLPTVRLSAIDYL